jgi:potassium efflux system protein
MNYTDVLRDGFLIVLIYFCAGVFVFSFHYFLRTATHLKTARLRIFSSFLFLLLLSCLYVMDQLSWAVYFQDPQTLIVYRYVTLTLWWLTLAFLVDKLLRFFVWDGVLARNGVSMVPGIMVGIISAFLYVIFISLMAHSVYHKSAEAILAVSGIVVFVLGFAAKNTVEQIFSGLSLNLAGHIKLEQVIEVDNLLGSIKEMNWRSVNLVSLDTTTLTIPNTKLANTIVENFSAPTSVWSVRIQLRIDACHDPSWVGNLLRKGIMNCAIIVDNPKSRVCLIDCYQHANIYCIKLYTLERGDLLTSEVFISIYYQLLREGVHFSVEGETFFPEGEYQESYEALVGQKDEEALIRLLGKNKIMSILSNEELAVLAKHAKRDCYFSKEAIFKEGDVGDTLFLIEEGSVQTYQREAENNHIPMRTLQAGECFGIKGMLLGESRRVTVRPCEKTFVYEIPRKAISIVLNQHTELVNKFSEALAARIKGNKGLLKTYQTQRELREKDERSLFRKLAKQIHKLFIIDEV